MFLKKFKRVFLKVKKVFKKLKKVFLKVFKKTIRIFPIRIFLIRISPNPHFTESAFDGFTVSGTACQICQISVFRT